jgi:hypothetical protein
MSSTIRFATCAATLLLGACASFPAPTQRMADAESAHRAAIEVGAATEPAAELHVKLAEEQMAQAKIRINDGDNRTADSLLIRSKADSELALALAREHGAKVDTQRAVDTSKTTAATNSAEGAVK